MAQMRSDSEQMQLQYQQYNANVQRHIQELNEQVTSHLTQLQIRHSLSIIQIKQVTQTNSKLEEDQQAMKKTYGSAVFAFERRDDRVLHVPRNEANRPAQ